MRSLSLPIPVAVFIRRLFNVFSTVTISSEYFIMRRGQVDGKSDEKMMSDGVRKPDGLNLVRSEVLAAQYDRAARGKADASSHRVRLKLWPWSTTSRPSTPRGTHTASIDELREKESFRDHERFDEKTPQPPRDPTPPHLKPEYSPPSSAKPLPPIYTLMNMATLFDPIRIPRNPIVLCHGLYGYDVRGPSSFPKLQLHYWANVLKVLKKKIGAETIVTGVPSTGSIESRADHLDGYLREHARGRDINFVAHSMGGLDCRHLISHVKPEDYNPASLTTICTPHRGSPFMDWCKENIGIGKLRWQAEEAAAGKTSEAAKSSSALASLASLPSSLTTLLLSVLDSPAYANLSTHYLRDVFNPATPDDPRVRYYSIAARTDSVSRFSPLWLPKMVLDSVESHERDADSHREEVDWGNDGLVTVRSAKWGEFLGVMEECDHWDIRGGGGLGPDAEWNLDLMIPALLKNSLSDPFSYIHLKAWAKMLTLWRKEEEERKSRNELKGRSESSGVRIVDTRASTRSEAGKAGVKPSSSNTQESDADDAILKSSTDKVSAMFDWVSEQVASSRKPSNSFEPASDGQNGSGTSSSVRDAEKRRVESKKANEAGDPRLKFDLERFYVALCRKLHDDGM